MKLFLTLPENLRDEMKFAALRAVLLFPKKVIRDRINLVLRRLGEKEFLREQYLGYKRLDVEIYEITRRLPRVPKFSGWIKSSSAVGSKHPQGPSFLEPLAIIENDYEDCIFDWYTNLTVDDSNYALPVELFYRPDEN